MISVCLILWSLLQPHLRFVCILNNCCINPNKCPCSNKLSRCVMTKCLKVLTGAEMSLYCPPCLMQCFCFWQRWCLLLDIIWFWKILSFQLFYLCINEKFVTITTVCKNNLLISLQYWSLLTSSLKEGNWGINWRMKFITIPWPLGYPASCTMMARKRLI